MSDLEWHEETRTLAQIKGGRWADNPRHSTAKQVKRLQESRQTFGQPQPFLMGPDGSLYDGHQRLDAWIAQYGPDMVVAVRVSNRALTEPERRQLAVFIHATATGEWNWDLLSGWDPGELQQWGFDSELLAGWNLDALNLKEMLTSEEPPKGEDPGAQIDKAEELREKWGTELGQLWQLGEHRLVCGDCTDPEVVARMLQSDVPMMMVTDPPYGVDHDPLFREKALGAADRRAGLVANDDTETWRSAFELFGGDIAYVWHADKQAIQSGLDLMACRFEIRATIIWSKPHSPYGQGHYNYQHEPCWYAVRKGAKSHWRGDHKDSTVWVIALDETAAGEHGTQKPLECMERPIRNHDTEIIYDPFVGSGTTLIACERLGRKCRAVEISPAYCAVTIQRWVDLTGGVPELVE